MNRKSCVSKNGRAPHKSLPTGPARFANWWRRRVFKTEYSEHPILSGGMGRVQRLQLDGAYMSRSIPIQLFGIVWIGYFTSA